MNTPYSTLGRSHGLLILMILFAHSASSKNKSVLTQQATEWMQERTFLFTENRGQMVDMKNNPVPFVLFKAEAPGINMYVTETGLTYTFLKVEEEKEKGKFFRPKEEEEHEAESFISEWTRIDLLLKDASIKKENIVREGTSVSCMNFFYWHCPNGVYSVKQFEKIVIKEVYPGIDWVFYNHSEKGVKYDFIVHPGADPAKIQMIYSSKEKLTVTKDGNLQINTKLGTLSENAPESFLDEKSIESKFKLISAERNDKGGYDVTIGFEFVDSQLPGQNSLLVIDPQLAWATFFGGNNFDGPMSVETDTSGNVFVGGYTYTASGNFPTQDPGGSSYYQGTFGGGLIDAFIMKFDNAGVLLWSTYYGGTADENVFNLHVDAAQNISAVGFTSSTDFPTQNPGGGAYFNGTNSGSRDAYILMFNNGGVRIWSTYFGGSGDDWFTAITQDNVGNFYMVGATGSGDFPTQNPGGGAHFQGGNNGVQNATIVKFNSGAQVVWSTYYGGNWADQAFSVCTNANGDVFVAGLAGSWGGTFSTQNPGGGAYYQAANGGGNDAFILKFNSASVRQWATYYGGTADDGAYCMAMDAGGNIFVEGNTLSTNFPTQNPGGGAYFQAANGGGRDAFILKFAGTGVRSWATYYGGTGTEFDNQEPSYDNIAIDSCGNVYMAFETSSADVPTLFSCDIVGYNDTTFNGSKDQFIVFFSNSGIREWATYLGGSGTDFHSAITLDADNNLFVTGEWTDQQSAVTNASYPLMNPGAGVYYDGTFNGADDGALVKFTPVPIGHLIGITNCSLNCDGAFYLNLLSGGCTPHSYLWSNGATTQNISNLCNGMYSFTVTDSVFCRTYGANNLLITGCTVGMPSIETNALQISVYPNPASDELEIQFSTLNSEEVTIEIVDVLGQVVFTQQLVSASGTNTLKMKVDFLSCGVYFLKVNADSKQESVEFLKN